MKYMAVWKGISSTIAKKQAQEKIRHTHEKQTRTPCFQTEAAVPLLPVKS